MSGIRKNAKPDVYAINGMIVIDNLYVHTERDADDEEDRGEIHTAHLYDEDDEPEEVTTGKIGAFPLQMTREQAIDLMNELHNRLDN